MKYDKVVSVAKRIVDAFKSGNVAAKLATLLLTTGGRNVDTYSWANRLLVILAGWSDAMGYKAWQKVGRQVRKGERATIILAPCKGKRHDDKTGEDVSYVYGYAGRNVFGLEQTDVVDAAKWAKHNAATAEAEKHLDTLPCREVADAWGLKLGVYNGAKSNALGWYRRGEAISLGVENLATWTHELCHAADYRNGKLVECGQHWRSETVAELGGAILLTMLGYETDADLGGAWDYISKYATTAKIEPIKACMDVLTRTCEAVTLILEAAEQVKSDKSETPTKSDEVMAA